jgi:hypothetical protein
MLDGTVHDPVACGHNEAMSAQGGHSSFSFGPPQNGQITVENVNQALPAN